MAVTFHFTAALRAFAGGREHVEIDTSPSTLGDALDALWRVCPGLRDRVATEFGRCLVASPLTVAIMVGMSVSDVSQKAIANLGWREIRLTHPLFVGDTLYSESEVLEVRESKSRPEAGVVTVRTTGRNQSRAVVCTFERTILVAKRGHSVEDRIDY